MTDNKGGPTGKFPMGKMDESDQGELAAQIGVTSDGMVVVNFNTPVSWVAMPPEDARHLAKQLGHAADNADKKRN